MFFSDFLHTTTLKNFAEKRFVVERAPLPPILFSTLTLRCRNHSPELRRGTFLFFLFLNTEG